MKFRKTILSLVFLIFCSSVLYAQELITKNIRFDLNRIVLNDSTFIEKLNHLAGDELFSDSSTRIISLFFEKMEDNRTLIVANIANSVRPDDKNIGYYIENGNTFIFCGTPIDEIFAISNTDKKTFVYKKIAGVKMKNRKGLLPYVTDYYDREWWFVYQNKQLYLKNDPE
jgi:hypothetical protein